MTDDRTPKPRESLLLPIVIPVALLAGIGLVLWGFSRVLLRLEPHVATATALVTAAAIVAIVAFAASRKRVGNGTLVSVVVGVGGVTMFASGVALLVGEPTPEAQQVVVAITAPAGAATNGFAASSVTAPSDEPFTIEFDNQDTGVQHNVVVTSDDPAKDPSATTFLTGAPVIGPGQVADPAPALAEGTYYFYCEFHPTTMTGSLTAAPGAPAGGGGPTITQTITASGLAFDTDTLTLSSDGTKLTFDNQDAGVPHNVAIFTDSSATDVLFKGDTVTGVSSAVYDIPAIKPGTYYFHCDFHPDTMNGSVTVVPGAGGGGGGPPPSEGGGSPPPPTSSAPPTSSPPPSTSGGETTTITASGLAFDLSTITLPADKEWQLTFDNEDTGVEHDLSIYTDQSAGTTKFHGDPVTGVATADYKIPPLAAGTYYFQCDFHPDSMHGTVTVG